MLRKIITLYPSRYKKNYVPIVSEIYCRWAELIQYFKIMREIHINRVKKKNHMTVSIKVERALDKV